VERMLHRGTHDKRLHDTTTGRRWNSNFLDEAMAALQLSDGFVWSVRSREILNRLQPAKPEP
jgi:hypothetical protein